jgi:hypothetical protein
VKTPPAASIRLGPSWWYRSFVVLFTIFLVAINVLFDCGGCHFRQKNTLLITLSVLAASWAVWDAWRPRLGALHYADGNWVLALGDIENQGTLAIALDLQSYLLVCFTPLRQTTGLLRGRLGGRQQPIITKQWLHLDQSCAPNLDSHGRTMAWQAMRRALYAPASSPSAQGEPQGIGKL